MDRRLYEHLVSQELVSRAHMQRFILRASRDKTGIVHQLLESGEVDESMLASELAGYLGTELVDPLAFSVDPTAVQLISDDMSRRHGVLPFALSESGDQVGVLLYDPEVAGDVLDTLKLATGSAPVLYLGPRTWVIETIERVWTGDWSNPEMDAFEELEELDVPFQPDELLVVDDSEEIILEEVITTSGQEPVEAQFPEFRSASRPPVTNTKPLPSSDISDGAIPRARLPKPFPTPGLGSSDDSASTTNPVDVALEDFEASLQSGGSVGSFDPGDEPEGFSLQQNEGFDLFEPSEADEPAHDILVRHEKMIGQLIEELRHQREILQALVEVLSDDGLVSKRQIRRQMSSKK